MNHATAELSSYLTKVLLLSAGGKCEDMRDFIWLLRSYLINSWIRQNLSRVATTTSARGIEHGAARPGYSPGQPSGHQTQERSVDQPGTNQRPVLPDVTNQRPGSGVSVCIAEDQLSPHQPTLASLSCTPVNTCQKHDSPELKQNLPHWIGLLLRQRLQNMMKRKILFNPSPLIKSSLSAAGFTRVLVVNPS